MRCEWKRPEAWQSHAGPVYPRSSSGGGGRWWELVPEKFQLMHCPFCPECYCRGDPTSIDIGVQLGMLHNYVRVRHPLIGQSRYLDMFMGHPADLTSVFMGSGGPGAMEYQFYQLKSQDGMFHIWEKSHFIIVFENK